MPASPRASISASGTSRVAATAATAPCRRNSSSIRCASFSDIRERMSSAQLVERVEARLGGEIVVESREPASHVADGHRELGLLGRQLRRRVVVGTIVNPRVFPRPRLELILEAGEAPTEPIIWSRPSPAPGDMLSMATARSPSPPSSPRARPRGRPSQLGLFFCSRAPRRSPSPACWLALLGHSGTLWGSREGPPSGRTPISIEKLQRLALRGQVAVISTSGSAHGHARAPSSIAWQSTSRRGTHAPPRPTRPRGRRA